MTIPFFKLHLAGDDCILVAQEKLAPLGFKPDGEFLGDIARALLDRRCGVGGRACIFVEPNPGQGQQTLHVRVYRKDGTEDRSGYDGLWCVARWALDTGRTSGGNVELVRQGRTHTLIPTDSRSFMAEIRAPRGRRMTLIVDGHPTAAYVFDYEGRYAVALASGSGAVDGPSPKRIRLALDSMEESAVPVVVGFQGADVVRLISHDWADRLASAVCAAAAIREAGRNTAGTIAEWRGSGGAVSFATFSPPPGDAALSDSAALIDRGRFWLEWTGPETLRVAGMAEYSFEGTYDY
jgi:hypothetical protein